MYLQAIELNSDQISVTGSQKSDLNRPNQGLLLRLDYRSKIKVIQPTEGDQSKSTVKMRPSRWSTPSNPRDFWDVHHPLRSTRFHRSDLSRHGTGKHNHENSDPNRWNEGLLLDGLETQNQVIQTTNSDHQNLRWATRFWRSGKNN